MQNCRSLIPCACLVYHPASIWSLRGVGGPIRPIQGDSALQHRRFSRHTPLFRIETCTSWAYPTCFDYLANLSLEIPSVEYVMMFLSIHVWPKLKCWSAHISIYTTRLYAVWRLLPPLDNCAHESSLTKIEYNRIWLWYYIIYGYIWSLVHSARCMCTYICWIYRYQVQVERKHWTFIRFVRLPTEELAFFGSSPRIQEDVLTGKSRAEFDKEFARWETLQWGLEWEMCITSFGYDEMMEIFPKT